MGRLAGLNAAEAAGVVVRPVMLFRVAFPSRTFYITDQAGYSYTYNSQTYRGDGTYLGMGSLSERSDGKVGTLSLKLSLASAQGEIMARCFQQEPWHFAEVEVLVGFVGATGAIVQDPDTFGVWYMSTGSQTGSMIELLCEPVTNNLRRTSTVLSSNADQQARYPGDTFLKYSAAMDDREFEWGGRRLRMVTGVSALPFDPFGGMPGSLIDSITFGGGNNPGTYSP